MWGRASWRGVVLAAALAAGAASCAQDAQATGVGLARAEVATTATTTAVTTTAPPPEPTTTTAAPAPPTTQVPAQVAAAALPRPARVLHEQPWVPYATTGPVTLHHPSDRVDAIGFHQSGHDGAQQQMAVAGAARWFTMESRDRDTGPQGAADIVVEPDREVRAPVTGTVLRGGTYTLYCDHVDQYVVIEPDARPGWEVKVLHIEGLAVARGQRVEAGVTRLAARSRVLPFPSQVEEHTAEPPWPHVHVEVVDPTVPDRPTGKGCP